MIPLMWHSGNSTTRELKRSMFASDSGERDEQAKNKQLVRTVKWFWYCNGGSILCIHQNPETCTTQREKQCKTCKTRRTQAVLTDDV